MTIRFTRFIVSSFVLAACLVAAESRAAEDKPFYIGLSGGLALPMDMLEEWAWKERGQTADLKEEMDNGWTAGIKLGYRPDVFKRMIALEVEYTYQRLEFDRILSPGFEAGPHTIGGFYSKATDSHLTFQSLFLNILVRYPHGRMHPYVGIGPGMTRADVSFNEPSLTREGFGFQENGDDDTFCYQILAGVDYDASDTVSIGAGYRYFSARPSMTWANGTSSDYDPVLHGFVLDVKCHF